MLRVKYGFSEPEFSEIREIAEELDERIQSEGNSRKG